MTPDAGKPATAKPETKKPLAKKPAKDINKSAEIRKIAAELKAKKEKPRPVVIIALLKKQGIEASSPQVSMVVKKMGFGPKKRSKGRQAAGRVSLPVAKKTSQGQGGGLGEGQADCQPNGWH